MKKQLFENFSHFWAIWVFLKKGDYSKGDYSSFGDQFCDLRIIGPCKLEGFDSVRVLGSPLSHQWLEILWFLGPWSLSSSVLEVLKRPFPWIPLTRGVWRHWSLLRWTTRRYHQAMQHPKWFPCRVACGKGIFNNSTPPPKAIEDYSEECVLQMMMLG